MQTVDRVAATVAPMEEVFVLGNAPSGHFPIPEGPPCSAPFPRTRRDHLQALIESLNVSATERRQPVFSQAVHIARKLPVERALNPGAQLLNVLDESPRVIRPVQFPDGVTFGIMRRRQGTVWRALSLGMPFSTTGSIRHQPT